jgi:hypothetical protein
MVKTLFLPIFEFHEANPAFIAIFVDAPISMETRQAKMALSAKLVEQVSRLLMLRKPDLPEKDAVYQAEVTMLVFKGFISDISHAPSKRKAKLVESLIDLVSMQFSNALD